jgi:multicomponent K+:H+ antiporter subunit G
MSRLHGPSKATTLGVGGCLIASMLFFGFGQDRLSIQELLITFFLFITAPVTAHFLAKAHLHQSEAGEGELPRPDNSGWSTFNAPTGGAGFRGRTDGRANP